MVEKTENISYGGRESMWVSYSEPKPEAFIEMNPEAQIKEYH